jgi:hypothetical protein
MKKKSKINKITDDMIGMDDRICSCASRIVDTVISNNVKMSDPVTSLKTIMSSLKHGQDKEPGNLTKNKKN